MEDKETELEKRFYKEVWGIDDDTVNKVVGRELSKQAKDEAKNLAVARYNESHRKDFLPSYIIDEAKRTGYYKKMGASTVFKGMRYVEDQMTGIGHIEGKVEGDAIGYFASIELWNGYKATIYVPTDQLKLRGNPENYALSMLIKTKGLQNYVKPDRSN